MNIIEIIAITLILAVGCFFVAAQIGTRNALRERQREMGEEFYSRVGGAQVDMIQATPPLGALFATQSQIVLIAFGGQYTIDRSEITGLSRYRSALRTGLLIEHQVSTLPKTLVFYTGQFAETRQALVELGYSVDV